MAICTLGQFRLDTQRELLFYGAEPAPLGRRAVALLRALVEQPRAVVSKEALIEAAWPNQAVEDSNLTVQIAALRRVLGQAPGGDGWIETMPRRGYRFIGPVGSEMQKGTADAPPQVDAPLDLAPTPHEDTQRRQITAVSCELIGIARQADKMDLEDWCEAVGAFRRCVSETIARHDGFIARHLGNTVLVLFGYPAAHEHDAERAVRAGLELCAAAGTLRPVIDAPIRCRVGVATGMVIVGDMREIGGGRDPEIVGDALNLAVQLQASTLPDTVVIECATRQLVGNLFDCRDLDAIETNRDAEPMRRWQVLAERIVESRFEALRGSALSPLIGREEEIDLLLRRWARAKAGNGQVVLISGEAGIGKSRIVAGFAERLHAEPHLHLRYLCSPHHLDSALFPFVDQLGRASAFARSDPPAAKLEKLEALLACAAPPDDDVAILADLMSLPTSDRHPLPNLSRQRKKERTLEALIRHIAGLARQQPVIIAFEDAHWIDPTSREVLDVIVERVRTLPVLMIVTFRPEFQAPWTGQPQVTTLTLNRLDRHDRRVLVERVAGKALPRDVVTQIADRTDGVPLFVEELTKSVLESGLLHEEQDRYVLDRALPSFAIPTTLHASLLARLDRLASVRLVAQIGAAIGREFSYELLRAVSRLPEDELQAALARLVASELVFQRGLTPDAVYSFKHALVRDAAHGSLLRSARQQLHAQIAASLETHFPDMMESQPELFAWHYGEAGFAAKSIACWAKAGRRSAGRSAMAEAAAQLQKGLDQLALLPNDRERQRQELELRSVLGAVLVYVQGFAAPEPSQAFARARELWEQLECPSEFLYIPYGQCRNHMYRGEFDLAQRSAEDLLRLSRQRNDSAGLVLGHDSSGRDLLAAGRFPSSRSHLEEVLALYDPIRHSSLVHQAEIHPQVNSRGLLGIALFCLGYPEQALAQSKAAITEARTLAHPPSLAASLAIGARLASLNGQDGALIERADELVAVATEQGFPLYRALGAIYRGWAKVKNGDVTDGMSLLRSGTATYRATGSELMLPYWCALLAGACETAGQIEEAMSLLNDATQIAERTGERFFAAELSRHKGRLLLDQRHSQAAEELYRKALSIAEKQGAKLWELRATVSIARLWAERGRRAKARDLLAPVYAWFTEGFDTADLMEAKKLLDALN